MRRFLCMILLLVGCTSEVASTEIGLNELDRQNQDVISPGPININGPHIEEEDNDLPVFDACLCEFHSWEERGLMCVGVICTEVCSQKMQDCNEARRACVPLERF